MTRIGEKIKFLRNKNGMTQKKLAKKLGVSESYINEIENGRKVVKEDIISKISKMFSTELDDVNMYAEESSNEEKVKIKPIESRPLKKKEINEVWGDAFKSILKDVTIFKMDLKTKVGVRPLPIISNKIEGHPKEKVFLVEVQDNDMIGFRIAKGDIAFAHVENEVRNNAICIVDYNGENVIRQIKKIDSSKILLVSNGNSIITHTVNTKDIKIIARLDKVEIKL
ncbi:MAG: helix-turn-helix domain-containing protein [Clostridium sp.]|nr:helix-turn-helix domain-containing protein [Clostridium sp.]